MERLKKIVLHPFFIGAYPTLALYAVNANQLAFQDVIRALSVILVVTVVLLLLLKLIRVSWQRGGLAISITHALFFSFGHVYLIIQGWKGFGFLAEQANLLMAIWAAAWILGVWSVIRVLKACDGFTLFFNVASIALIVSTLLTIVFNAGSARQVRNLDIFPTPQPGVNASSQPPDIYYVILDGYARDDLLQEVLSYDNSELIQFLESRGFYVARKSTSNYGQTAVSLASSLNFDYINILSESIGKDSGNYSPLRTLIKDNRARRFLTQQGYHFVSFESGYSISDIQDADTYISYGIPLNNFEIMLLQNSVAVVWLDQSFTSRYRTRIVGTLDQLGELASVPSPKFVFAHTMAAHAPYVFGPNGEVINSDGSQAVHDTEDSIQEHIQVYTGQITYINRLVENAVDEILRNSARDPVIILQADHGSPVYMNWQSREQTCMHERMAIFNAYYLPDGKTDLLYPEISPVNSFRVVFDAYFDTHLGLLEDKSYYSIWEKPYDYEDVTDELGTQCSQTAGN